MVRTGILRCAPNLQCGLICFIFSWGTCMPQEKHISDSLIAGWKQVNVTPSAFHWHRVTGFQSLFFSFQSILQEPYPQCLLMAMQHPWLLCCQATVHSTKENASVSGWRTAAS